MTGFVGPTITDYEFFTELLDDSIEGLQECMALAKKGDYAAARHSFASYIRGSLQYEKFYRIPFRDIGNANLLPGEDDLQAADRICQHNIVSCNVACQFGDTVDWFANPTYNRYEEWTWQLSRHWEWRILAHAYLLTGEQKYADCFAGLAQSWLKQAVCPEPGTPSYETLCWRTIECGLRMGFSWPYALHAFAKNKAFTDDLLVDWYKAVWQHGRRMQYDHHTHNWFIMEMNGLFQISVVYPVFKKSKEWRQFSLDMLQREMEGQVYPDDFQYELSTGYHFILVENYSYIAETCKAYEIEFPKYFTDMMERLQLFYLKLMMPNGNAPDINDSSFDPIKTRIEKTKNLYPDNEQLKWVLTDRKEGKAPDYKSIILPYAGMIAMRTGWGENDVYGFFESAPFGAAHQHEDKLNFLLYAYGKYLLPDASTFDYDSSEMRKLVLSTRGHNTVRVNDCDQNRRLGYRWNPEDLHKKSDLQAQITEEYDYAAGIYNEGYAFKPNDPHLQYLVTHGIASDEMPPKDTSIVHRRSVLFLKKTAYAKPFFVITDRMEAPEGADNMYGVQWRTNETDVCLESPLHVSMDGLHLFASGEMENTWVKILCGQVKPEWDGWYSATHRQLEWEPRPVIKFYMRGACRRMVTLIYPSENGECPFAGIKASDDIADTAFTLLLKDGREIALDEKDFMCK